MTDIHLRNLTEYFSSDPINWARVFVDSWIYLFGSMFWGIMVIVLGMVIYEKTERIEPMIVWFIISTALGSTVFPNELLYLLGTISGVAVGFLLYRVLMHD